MATLTTQNITRAGVTPTLAAAAGGGDAMECGSGMFFYVNNAGASTTITFVVPAARVFEPNVAITSPAIVVASGIRFIGPIDAGTFADPTTGLCTINYTSVASVTVGAIKLTQP